MKYCVKCLQPNTRPNQTFDKDGICPPCNYHEKLPNVDWEERYEILLSIANKYRNKNKGGFDCIIGVSGGKDSTRQALFVRDKLKLNPLLVCLSFPPQQISKRGAKNISNLIDLGFDTIISAPAPITWKNLMKSAFDKFANYGRSTELALYAAVPQVAIRYNINLIWWGENPGLQVGDMGTLGKTGYDGNNLRNMNTLSGGEYQWIIDKGHPEECLMPYRYPSSEDFEKLNLEIIYLGWFWGRLVFSK